MEPAPIVDELLARLFANRPDPVEKLQEDQSMAFFLASISGLSYSLTVGRLVQLVCRHYKVTRAHRRTGCPRCGAMIRAGYDYDAFRNLGHADTFEWPGDPLRGLHQKERDL
jgi:hypothetical protein